MAAQEVATRGRGVLLWTAISLDRLVCPVAIRWRLRVLTLTQGHFFRFIDRKLQRLEAGSFMCPVTERLVP